MQINRVPVHPAYGVVLPEYVVRRLSIILIHQGAVALPFFGERVRGGAIVAGVGLVGLGAGVSEVHTASGGWWVGGGLGGVVYGCGYECVWVGNWLGFLL